MNCFQKQPPLEVPNVIRTHTPSGTPDPDGGCETTVSISAEVETCLGIQSINPNFVKDRSFELKSPETDPHVHGQLIYNTNAKVIQ